MTIDLAELMVKAYSTGSFLLLYVAVFFLANVVYARFCRYSLKEEIVERDNAAVAIALAGYLLAISIIFVGCVLGPSVSLLDDLLVVVKFCSLGVLLLFLAHWVNDKLILHRFDNRKELVEDRNVGTGAVQAGSYIASGLIVAGSIHGEGGGLLTALVFFLLGQLCLVLIAKIYDRITRFDVHQEIEQDNTTAGVAFSGSLVALGIILSKSAGGDFISWQENLSYFAVNALLAFILLPLFRVVIDKLVIVGDDLNREIAEDKNLGAGFLEFGATVGFAVVLFFVV